MLSSSAVALSLAILSFGSFALTLDVPFVPQTDALCGGAAVSMVFRYWGDAHADVQQFAALVDAKAGGIADDVLVDAVKRRGWNAVASAGSIDTLHERLRDRRPLIVLLADRGNRYHYVVVTGATPDAIVVHDPSWGPSRRIALAEFERRWRASRNWSLVISPGAHTRLSSGSGAATRVTTVTESTSACDTALAGAIAMVRERGLSDADAILGDMRARCPHSAGPIRELAGVRFAQRRWAEATALAREAATLDQHDAYAWEVLGSSLFMQDRTADALRAWNHIGKPRVDRVNVHGLGRVRYQTISDAVALEPNTTLTADAFERARRRLDALPNRATTRLRLRPQQDGFATVEAAVVERATWPPGPHGKAEWIAAAARVGVDREVTARIPGAAGEGELWTASWRWWEGRPRVAVDFAAPRTGRLPGIWRVDASWESESYIFDRAAMPLRTSRMHGGFTVGDWVTGNVRYAMSGGIDVWDGARKAPSLGFEIERRVANDRVAISGRATWWLPLFGGQQFNGAGARVRYVSSEDARRWVLRAVAGTDRVSAAAPLPLWPGAGEGRARAALLRAHPLLEDGAIAASPSSAFGRTLTYATVEGQRWFDRPALLRIGIAGFADIARAIRQIDDRAGTAYVDVGGGIRMKAPGWDGVLRIDVAYGIRDGRNALTFGWMF